MKILNKFNKNNIIEKMMMWFFFGLVIFSIFISLSVIKNLLTKQ